MLKNCFHLEWEHETIISDEEKWTKKIITIERPLSTQFKISFQIKFTTEPTIEAFQRLTTLLTCFKNLLKVEISPKHLKMPTTISVDANGEITASISPKKLLTTDSVRVEILRLHYSSTSGGEVKFTYVLRVGEQVRL